MNIARLPPDVTLVAVTKTFPVETIIEAYQAGIRHFGENYVEEFAEKYAALPLDIKKNTIFHMIGHVQSRKIKKVVELFDWVDSVDSVRLANKLNEEAKRQGRSLSVLLEVNLSGEPTKSGFAVEALHTSIGEIVKLPHLTVAGFMTMPAAVSDAEGNRAVFGSLTMLSQELRVKYPSIGPQLSMGTSQDYRVAIEEGATMIRLGTALFGLRQLQK